jgi:hypothetical protein
MIDRVPQWFEMGMLIDHRGSQVSVSHNVANKRRVLRLCHRVGAEGMARVSPRRAETETPRMARVSPSSS